MHLHTCFGGSGAGGGGFGGSGTTGGFGGSGGLGGGPTLMITGFCLIFLRRDATQTGSIVPTTVSTLFPSSSEI